MTVEYAVYPIGSQSEGDQTGRITITVMPLPTTGTPNQPPVARSFSTSVTAGDPLTITVPSSGVDPDGDRSPSPASSARRASAVDLRVRPGHRLRAVDHQVRGLPDVGRHRDPQLRGPRPVRRHQPGLRADRRRPAGRPAAAGRRRGRGPRRPGKTVTVDATLERPHRPRRQHRPRVQGPRSTRRAELAKWKVDEANTYFTTKVPDPQAGVQHLTYGISNGLFDPSRSRPSPSSPYPRPRTRPIAVDDTAKPKPDETSTLVDALANDRDVDGTRESLTLVRGAVPRRRHRGRPGAGPGQAVPLHRPLRHHRRGRPHRDGADLRARRARRALPFVVSGLGHPDGPGLDQDGRAGRLREVAPRPGRQHHHGRQRQRLAPSDRLAGRGRRPLRAHPDLVRRLHRARRR